MSDRLRIGLVGSANSIPFATDDRRDLITTPDVDPVDISTQPDAEVPGGAYATFADGLALGKIIDAARRGVTARAIRDTFPVGDMGRNTNSRMMTW